MLDILRENVLTLLQNPTSLLALFGVLILIAAAIQARHVKLSTRILVNVSLLLALATVLHFLRDLSSNALKSF